MDMAMKEESKAAVKHLIARVRENVTEEESKLMTDKLIIGAGDEYEIIIFITGWLEAKGFNTTGIEFDLDGLLESL